MKILLSIFLIVAVLEAKTMINGIAFFVNEEPITLYRLYKKINDEKVSRDDAMEILIKEKLHEISYKKHNIKVDDIEVENQAKEIADKNNMTLFELRGDIINSGISWGEYIERLRSEMKKERLYNEIVSAKLRIADEDELKNYYDKNRAEFEIPSTIDTIKYFSNSKNALEETIKNPLLASQDVVREKEVIDIKSISKSLRDIFFRTRSGNFTPILPIQNLFVSFYIVEKRGVELLGYEEIKDMIFAKVMSDRESELIDEHFNRLRATAKVKVLRLE